MPHTPTLLLILDGFGKADPGPGNAITQAGLTNVNRLFNAPGVSVLACGGRDVGLPAGYMGNSEVGHLNIGAGRVVYQDMARIDVAIETGELGKNPALNNLLAKIKAQNGRIHFMGLLSDAGVHSHIAHLEALIDIAAESGVKSCVHAFTDGRDTSPHSGADFVTRILEKLRARGGRLATLCGRFYAMDRDKRWERVKQAWDMLIHGQGEQVADPVAALRTAYGEDETDEFLKPRQVGNPQDNVIRDGDGVFFFNFRADRARELAAVFSKDDFTGFERGKIPGFAGLLAMVSYDEALTVPLVFHKDNLEHTLGEVVSDLGMAQLRIAETEKYAHVTYFFSGGREEVFSNEDRILVDSPKDVATYDLKPQMSALEVCDKLIAALDSKKYSFLVCNFANPDMVGHTGNLQATIEALQTVDACVGKILARVDALGMRLLLVSDHGNADEMIAGNGEPSTAHSLNPVCMAVYEQGRVLPLLPEGRLADIAPTLLHFWGITPPAEMTGCNLAE